LSVRVRFVDLERLHAPIRGELDMAIARVVDSGQFILGAEVEAFEREIAAELGVRYAVGLSSGSDAILASLWAAGVGPGDEVITPSFSFASVAEAIIRLGAAPVFADVADDFNIDVADTRRRMTDRTRAIVAVDLFGRRARVGELGALSSVFEDAAQAVGRGVGSGVRAAALSFFPTKNLGALGDGGLVATDDQGLAQTVRELRVHGATRKYFHERVGWNMRLDALQAAVLRVKLPHLREWNEARAGIARRYRAGLEGIAGLDLPPDHDHVWHQFVVGVDHRAALRDRLAAREVETEVYYPVALHEVACFGHHGPLPKSERAARRALALPIHAALSAAEIEHVIEAVREEICCDAQKPP
jgi:dTDP-4-amino-4,6-dideoxygalactose transaminase